MDNHRTQGASATKAAGYLTMKSTIRPNRWRMKRTERSNVFAKTRQKFDALRPSALESARAVEKPTAGVSLSEDQNRSILPRSTPHRDNEAHRRSRSVLRLFEQLLPGAARDSVRAACAQGVSPPPPG